MRKSVKLFFVLMFCFLSTQSLLGADAWLPAHADGQLVRHAAYVLQYNERYEQADWVAYKLTAGMLEKNCSRTNDFRPDPSVESGSAILADYRGSGFDRGHLVPAADMVSSPVFMSESFFMSNMSPQYPGFNRGCWARLEALVRRWAKENTELYIVTGPVLDDGMVETIGKNHVGVPSYYYKVILDYTGAETKGIGFVMPNHKSRQPISNYAVSIDYVELRTGIDFFPDLPDNIEESLESKFDTSLWSFP